jgi:LacI family transcriptional regulator
MNTTLKLLAQQLQLSISTVSRALKDHPDISTATKEKVHALANSLDYEPNAYAIQLRTQSSKIFGVIVPAIANLFYDSFIAAIEEESRKNGYALMILQSSNNTENELNNLKIFRQNRVSGVFACLSAHTQNLEVYEKMSDRGIPVVFFDIVPKDNKYTKVRMADERCAIIAAENIIQRGAKRVLALFGDPALSISQKRKHAFQEFMGKYAPKTHCTYVDTNSSEEAEKAFDSVMKKIYKQLKDSKEYVVKINMPVFFTSSSNGRNGHLLQMVTSELQSNGFDVEKSIDGRHGDKYDWVKIRPSSYNIDFYK